MSGQSDCWKPQKSDFGVVYGWTSLIGKMVPMQPMQNFPTDSDGPPCGQDVGPQITPKMTKQFKDHAMIWHFKKLYWSQQCGPKINNDNAM